MSKVAANTPALAVLVGGCLVAGALGANVLVAGSASSRSFAIPLLGLFIFAFVAVTRHGVPVTPSAIAVGGIVGLTAAFGHPVLFMLWPPLPASHTWAFVLVVAALAVASAILLRTGGRLVDAVLGGLLAAIIPALLIAPTDSAMVSFGPASWVPQIPITRIPSCSPCPTYPSMAAAELATRRELAEGRYLTVVVLGAGLALILGVVALLARRHVRATGTVRPAGGPQLIDLGDF